MNLDMIKIIVLLAPHPWNFHKLFSIVFIIANAVKWIFYNRKIVCKMAEGTTIKIAVKKPLRFGLLLQGKGINQKKF